uniref:Band 7 domain-containing protein n=1 Tax=Pelagomonas calceolata TaxID=35677 RepID=A0A7S4E3K8_9STRA
MAAICQGCLCFQCVTTSEIGIIERCGRYERLAPPGLRCVCWPLETVAGRISRRIQQLDVACVTRRPARELLRRRAHCRARLIGTSCAGETKTSDNVFLNVIISVQYKVKEEYVYEAFYVLNDPSEQIKSYVYDVVRSTLPLLTLDKAFESKEMVAQSVKRELSGVMSEYGFVIHNALVTDISPDGRVKTAMNEINASKRLKEAAFEKAEGVIYQCANKTL